jgi:GNAT superfamily N-acetyltransferase
VVDAPPLFTHLTVHNEFHTHPEERVAALEAAGCALFQEKHGYVWVDDGQTVGVPDRLEFRTLEEVGDEAYGAVMGPTQEGTLDRNDVYYWGGTGPDAWAGVFLSIAGDDRCSWLAGFAGDEPVGFMAISAFHEPGAGTIAHCGVLPEHRGNGYMGDLLAAGTAVARERGFSSIVSDVDVVNHPMIAAMLRAGHRDDVRPWHTWVFRKHR